VVKDAYLEFGVGYLEQSMFAAAIALYYRWLRQLGLPIALAPAAFIRAATELQPQA